MQIIFELYVYFTGWISLCDLCEAWVYTDSFIVQSSIVVYGTEG